MQVLLKSRLAIHTRTVRSTDTDAIRFAFGDNTTFITGPAWSCSSTCDEQTKRRLIRSELRDDVGEIACRISLPNEVPLNEYSHFWENSESKDAVVTNDVVH